MRAVSNRDYQRIVLMNMRLGGTILGLVHLTETFEECFEMAGEFEEKVMFKKQETLAAMAI